MAGKFLTLRRKVTGFGPLKFIHIYNFLFFRYIYIKLPFLSEFRQFDIFGIRRRYKFLLCLQDPGVEFIGGEGDTRLTGAPKKKLFDRVDKPKTVCYILDIEDSWSLEERFNGFPV